MMYATNRVLAGFLLLLGLQLWVPSPAQAFGPDVCFLNDGSITNCTPLPPECPPGNESQYCIETVARMSDAVSEQTGTVGAKRSMLHMDFTFFAAQFVGFSRDEAYFIGAYDDATDLGRYVPRDIAGRLLVSSTDCDAAEALQPRCVWVTKPMMGINKVNIVTGGIFYHFHAPHNGHTPSPVEVINGIEPNTDDPYHEPFLSHLRRWANPASSTHLWCAHGLTTATADEVPNYAYGDRCYGDDTPFTSERITGELMLWKDKFQRPKYTPYSVLTGPQVVQMGDADGGIDSTQFDEYVGYWADMARIGIYLHAYQDRLSHYRCVDDSYLNGPYDVPGFQFFENMRSVECDQRVHVLRHAWETGTDQSQLLPRDRTLEAGMIGTYNELLKFAQDLGIAPERALDPEQRQAFIDRMLQALQIGEAQTRMLEVSRRGTAEFGLRPMPGYPDARGAELTPR